jgi:hypothetical protein
MGDRGGGGGGSNGSGNAAGFAGTGGGGTGRTRAGLYYPVTGFDQHGGGGGAGTYNSTAGAGGSGIIFIKIPSSITPTFTAGVSQTSSTSGGVKTITITAAGVSDTVTFS